MSWHWKELLPVDSFTVRVSSYLTDLDQKVITLLYQPLVGALAHSLYMTLWSQLERDQYWSESQTHRQLMLMMNIPLQTIFEERKKLEAIGLLKTYKNSKEEGSSYLYELQQPMSPKQFFENDVLSVYLFNRLGKQKYRQLRERFTEDKVDKGEYTELTHSFDEIFHSLHHSEIVSNLQSETSDAMKLNEASELLGQDGDSLTFIEENFDFELMKKDLSSFIVPEQLLTKEVNQAIIRLAFVYRIEPLQMSRIVGQAVLHDDEVDIDLLRKKAQEWYKIEHSSEPPGLGLKVHPIQHQTMTSVEPKTEEEKIIKFYETTPPLTLLEIRSDGAYVAPADAKIVESLLMDYQLLPGVANVLIDYVLFQHDMKLQKALIDKIAAHWARKKINKVADAMVLAREEQEKKVVAKERSQSNASSKRTQGPRKNTRRDRLPKWLVEEKEKEKNKDQEKKMPESSPETTDAKERFDKMMEELKKRKREKGEI
jgi:replication initiation and membrane attachment protein